MAKKRREPPNQVGAGGFTDLALAVSAPADGEDATVRIAGGLLDMELDVSPASVGLKKALRHMAKAINIAFQSGYLQNRLEAAYEAARVHKGTVEILHRDYVGLGDGVFASIGKTLKSIKLSFTGADPASPRGRQRREMGEDGSPLGGLLNLLGRKMNLIQEYEGKVPEYLQQLLDRLEASGMIVGWSRDEWGVQTKKLGLDIVLRPVVEAEEEAAPAKKKKAAKKKAGTKKAARKAASKKSARKK